MTKEEIIARKIEKMFLTRHLDLDAMGLYLKYIWEYQLQTIEEILEPARLARQEQGVK
jgi:hypothetical protein